MVGLYVEVVLAELLAKEVADQLAVLDIDLVSFGWIGDYRA